MYANLETNLLLCTVFSRLEEGRRRFRGGVRRLWELNNRWERLTPLVVVRSTFPKEPWSWLFTFSLTTWHEIRVKWPTRDPRALICQTKRQWSFRMLAALFEQSVWNINRMWHSWIQGNRECMLLKWLPMGLYVAHIFSVVMKELKVRPSRLVNKTHECDLRTVLEF